MTYWAVAGIALLGSFVQAASGFGYALICMALFPLLLPFRTASIIEVVTAFVLVVYIAVRLRKSINFKLLLWPSLAAMCVSTFGVFALMASTETLLRRILGGALICLSLYFHFFSSKLRLKPTRTSGIIAGMISGFCGGLLNIGGPPMVAYFLSVTDDKQEYNATLQCYFTITTLYIFLLHFIMGNVTGEILQLSGAALVGLGLGTLAGMRLFRRLSMSHIRKCVCVFMSIAGIYFIIIG